MGLYKRGGVWWMRFSHKGKQERRSMETTNKRMAEKIQAKVLTQIAEGKWLDVSKGRDTTFAELLGKYLSEHSSKKAVSGERRDVTSSKHLLPFFGDMMLDDITPKLISDYKSLRYSTGAMPATINREMSLMKHSFSLAVREWELCTDNPVKRVSMERENNARDRWLESEEEEQLLDASPHWLQELIAFALNTGMRMEEILSLSWQQVSIQRRTATILRSKNGEKRTIPLNHAVLTLLQKKSKVRYLSCSFVFPTPRGTKYDQGNVRRAFIATRKKAGIADLRFHDLRHTFATRLVQKGADLYKVQKLLGHKTPIMTQRYAHHFPESLRDAVDLLGGTKASTILAQSTKKGLRENP
jgi:integrase